MENLQSEVLFIIKFGGIIGVAATHYFAVIKPIAIFNERQKNNKRFIDCHEADLKNLKSRMDILETKHNDKWCEEKRSEKR